MYKIGTTNAHGTLPEKTLCPENQQTTRLVKQKTTEKKQFYKPQGLHLYNVRYRCNRCHNNKKLISPIPMPRKKKISLEVKKINMYCQFNIIIRLWLFKTCVSGHIDNKKHNFYLMNDLAGPRIRSRTII